jgi:hypothetical protein
MSIVTKGTSALARPETIALSAQVSSPRLSSPERREHVERQAARLSEDGGAGGDPVVQVVQVVQESASGAKESWL